MPEQNNNTFPGLVLKTEAEISSHRTSFTKSAITMEILKDRDKTADYVEKQVRAQNSPNLIIQSSQLPPITDPIEQKILDLVTKDPDLTDKELIGIICDELDIKLSRQAITGKRKILKRLGYRVR
jgi:hypothetical protein